MYVNPNNRTSSTTTLPLGARTGASKTSADASSFEAQLSSALSESLQKLGVGGGEVNISIRNPTASTRQIVVTYTVEGGSEATPAAGNPTPPTTTPSSAPTAPQTPSKTEPATSTDSGAPRLNPFTLPYTPYIPPVNSGAQVNPTSWAPYDGPRDFRDQMPVGGGKTTHSGAPLIEDNAKAAGNQYGFTGPAAKNPYFSTPSNPLREGYVLGFKQWFESPMILGMKNGPQPANKFMYATEEGAQEALRITKLFEPEAKIVKSIWFSGPFSVDKEMYEIELSGGRKLNAGGVLSAYYTHGYGVTPSSDETIRRSIQLA